MNVDMAIVAVADFLRPFMPTGTQLARGMANGVPQPKSPCVIITEVGQTQYTTTRTKLDANSNTMEFMMPRYLNLQLDFYGLDAGSMIGSAITMLRSKYTVGKFPDGLAPLFCTDGVQAPLITGEKQFETRWLCTLSLQYNSHITVEQDSFINVGDSTVTPVDVIFPAE